MERVKGRDAHFFYEERAAQPMHTLKVGILDPAGTPGLTVDDLRRILAGRAPKLAPLRRRVALTPGRLFHPLWLEGGPPDLDYHVRAETAPAPGGNRELGRVVSAIASAPLDRTRPLWELWLIDGLAGGRLALVFKLHHSLADGLSSAQLIVELMDGAEPGLSTAEDAEPDAVPSTGAQVRAAGRELVRLLPHFPALAARSRRASAVAARRRKSGATMPAKAFTGPMLPWNRGLTPNRSYGFTTVALDDLRHVKDAVGCTLNDTVLAVAAGAVRGYLGAHGGLPQASLTAAVPVSIRRPDESHAFGNRLSNVFPTLATDIEDPIDRLHAIHTSMAAAKEHHDARDPELWQDWWDFYPLLRVFQKSAIGLMHRTIKRPTYNVIVSSVRGPSKPLFANRVPLQEIHSMGPLVDDLGLNITAWSYLDRMSFGVVTCAELVPDVWDLVDRIPDALGELLAASGAPAR